jgi:histidine triad (HIT) family protein
MMGTETACIFCEIVAGRADAHRIDENRHALAVLDIQPFAPGHTLVLSRRHVPWWHDLTEEEAGDVFALAHRVANRLKATFDPEFVCLYARGRRVPHTHIFLVPSGGGDLLDRAFNDLERKQETSEELAALRRAESREEAARKIRGGSA